MRSLAAAVLFLAVASLAPPAAAQSALPPITVDRVELRFNAIRVTGVPQGGTESTSRDFTVSGFSEAQRNAMFDRCHRSLLLALSKPGQYVASVGVDVCAVSLAAP